MINKRLLVKNLLAHNDENSFYDKKRFISIGEKEGKAKFLKHVCALANSNPTNNSFIVVGVEDEDNKIVGVDFFDDSKIQNLVNAYLDNPPIISYENIPFPHLPEGKVVGLVTIKSNGKVCALRKNIWKYYGGAVFFREGSISLPKAFDIKLKDINSQKVATIEQHARNNIELTLDGVIDFINNRHADLTSDYKVFKEQFVVCWAGHRKKVKKKTYYSRVDIELINEAGKTLLFCFRRGYYSLYRFNFYHLGIRTAWVGERTEILSVRRSDHHFLKTTETIPLLVSLYLNLHNLIRKPCIIFTIATMRW